MRGMYNGLVTDRLWLLTVTHNEIDSEVSKLKEIFQLGRGNVFNNKKLHTALTRAILN